MKHRLSDLVFIAACLVGIALLNTAGALAALLGKEFDGLRYND